MNLTRRTRRLVAGTTLAATALLAACGGQEGRTAAGTPERDGTGAGASAATAEQEQTGSTVARAAASVDVHPEPDAPPSHTLPATTGFGSPRALLVLEEDGEWLKVALPGRPNGSTGWVRRDGLDLRTVDESIQIDLQERTLTLFDGGDMVLTTPVAIGTPGNPTPTGAFYVVDKLDTADTSGAYGPYAFGISAHSETLTEFAGGDGQVGIHGTNDPSTIGEAVSHGCIRVPNDVARTLNERINLGTPVAILG